MNIYQATQTHVGNINIRYTFLSNHNIHKSLFGLCFWAPDPLINAYFTKIYQLKGLVPKNKGHKNFYERCDMTKNISNLDRFMYMQC